MLCSACSNNTHLLQHELELLYVLLQDATFASRKAYKAWALAVRLLRLLRVIEEQWIVEELEGQRIGRNGRWQSDLEVMREDL